MCEEVIQAQIVNTEKKKNEGILFIKLNAGKNVFNIATFIMEP